MIHSGHSKNEQDFLQFLRSNQEQEKREFEESIEKFYSLLSKYRQEVYSKELPDLQRLMQIERIVSQFIDIITVNKYQTDFYNMQVKTESFESFSGYLEWKKFVSEKLTDEYTTFLNSVSIRIRQTSMNLNNSKFFSSVHSLGQELIEEEKIIAEEHLKEENRRTNITQRELALFYFYVHDTGEEPAFESGKMIQSYKEAAGAYNLSYKPFQQFYSSFHKGENRRSSDNIEALKKTIISLERYPDAHKKACDDLRTAMSNNGKK